VTPARGEIVVARFGKNAREEVRVTVGEYRGRQVADFRVWTRLDDHDQPTRKGLTIRVEQVPELLAAVHAVMEVGRAA
jgi:hypothetical protein